jgi:hypothetical protein
MKLGTMIDTGRRCLSSDRQEMIEDSVMIQWLRVASFRAFPTFLTFSIRGRRRVGVSECQAPICQDMTRLATLALPAIVALR